MWKAHGWKLSIAFIDYRIWAFSLRRNWFHMSQSILLLYLLFVKIMKKIRIFVKLSQYQLRNYFNQLIPIPLENSTQFQ